VLLDAGLLVDLPRQGHRLENTQRVATTAVAIAELCSIAGTRGEFIRAVRLQYVARVARALPVLSLEQGGALGAVERPAEGGRASAAGVFRLLAEATAEALEWPLVD
jgi:hypothetical protein